MVKKFADEVIELTSEVNELYDEGLEEECQTKINAFNKELHRFFTDTIKIGFKACSSNPEIISSLINIQEVFNEEFKKYNVEYYITNANSEWIIRKVKIETNLNKSIATITRLSTNSSSLTEDLFLGY